jgi:hypothetical protein
MLSGVNASEFTASGLSTPFNLAAKQFVTFTVCCTPGDIGYRTATYTISGISSGQPTQVAINYNINGLSKTYIVPMALFGNEKVIKDTKKTEDVTITNGGTSTRTFTATITKGEDYTIQGSAQLSLAPGASSKFTVAFIPVSSGDKSGMLMISAPGLNDGFVTLGGIGACAVPVAKNVDLGSVAAGTTDGTTVEIPIINNGNYDWTVGTPQISPGDAFSFVAYGSSAVIAAGGNGTIKVNFRPMLANAYTAEITFPASGPCSESDLKIAISGQGVMSGVSDIVEADGFRLDQSTPNPAFGLTTIGFTTPAHAQVRIALADVTGKIVKEIANGSFDGGVHTVNFNASDIASGSYVYILESGATRLTRSLVVTK